MVKWRLRQDSARQIGLQTTLESVLTIVESGIAGAEDMQAEFFAFLLHRRTSLSPTDIWRTEHRKTRCEQQSDPHHLNAGY